MKFNCAPQEWLMMLWRRRWDQKEWILTLFKLKSTNIVSTVTNLFQWKENQLYSSVDTSYVRKMLRKRKIAVRNVGLSRSNRPNIKLWWEWSKKIIRKKCKNILSTFKILTPEVQCISKCQETQLFNNF